MVKIKIKDQVFEIDRIVSFGCSFTAGTELLDHTLGPYAAQKEEFKSLKKRLRSWFQEINKDGKYSYEMQQNRTYHEPGLAWPSKLAENLKVPCRNFAYPGNSNDRMLYQLQQELIYDKIRSTDLVLIGITSMNRGLFFDTTLPNNTPEAFLLTEVDSFDKWVDPRFFLDWMTDERMVWNHILHLGFLESIKQQLDGRLFCVNMLPLNIEGFGNKIYNPDINIRLSKLNYTIADQYYLFMKKTLDGFLKSDLFLAENCFYDMVPQGEQLPFMHPTEKAHKNYADWLTELIKVL
jgi:hypothetical protein